MTKQIQQQWRTWKAAQTLGDAEKYVVLSSWNLGSRSWLWAWGSHLTVRTDMTFMNFFRKLFGNEAFMRSYTTLKGLFEFKVLPWIFSCHGRGLSSAGQAGSTSALLPKPHYKLDGFRVRRTGGLRRRLQLETGGCYTWWSVCIPVQEPFWRVCHKTLSYDTCSFAELMVWHLKSLG